MESTHAWNSLPTEDDITDFDEINTDYEPTAAIRKQAEAVFEVAVDILGREQISLPYARIDDVTQDSTLVLMEMELIEPSLGRDRDNDTVERFCETIISYVKARAGSVN